MTTSITFSVLLSLTLTLTACDHEFATNSQEHRIIGGSVDNNADYDAVPYLLNTDGYACGGTLIYPNILLTAAHCVTEDESTAALPASKLEAYFCRDLDNCDSITNMRRAIEVYVHPSYEYSSYYGDFALVRLEAPAPSWVIPITPLPPSLELSSPDDDGISITFVGYGRTVGTDPDSATTVRMVIDNILEGVCHDSSSCTLSWLTGQYAAPYTLYVDESVTGTCKGDSGGPGLVFRNGALYVAGITSYGYNDCSGPRVYTEVSHYTSEIESFVNNPPLENCTNGLDDDGNGLLDCLDPQCQNLEICSITEVETECDDGIDNDDDTLSDCEDPDCSDATPCILPASEVDCGDNVDNDSDGLIDCEDPDCTTAISCNSTTLETNCEDGLDNDNDGVTDCDDSDCQENDVCEIDSGSNSDSGCHSAPNTPSSPSASFIMLTVIFLFGLRRYGLKKFQN